MSVIVDTSFVFALYNHKDANHWDARAFALSNSEEVIVADVILPELGFLFQRDFGYAELVRFLDRFRNINWSIESPLRSDLERVFDLADRYASAELMWSTVVSWLWRSGCN